MSGIQTIRQVETFKRRCDDLGFGIAHSKYAQAMHSVEGDVVGLYPKDEDHFPIYHENNEIYYGTIDQVNQFLDGVEWARRYDEILFGENHDENRENLEQKLRNQKLINKIK